MIYLNTAATGIVSKETLEAAEAFLKQLSINSSQAAEHWRSELMSNIRKETAHFMGVQAENLAFIPNFSIGWTAVLMSLPKDASFLIYRHDYPSLLDPILSNGFQHFWIEGDDDFHISFEEIEHQLMQQRPSFMVISHVQWLSGFKIDLEKLGHLCKQYGTALIIDGTQSLGAFNLHLKTLAVDVFIASNYKWMNAGFGTGVLYMTDHFFKTHPPILRGYNSYSFKNNEMVYESSLRDMEPGHLNMSGLLMLQKAVEEKMKMGLEKIEAHNYSLSRYFLENLQSISFPIVGPYQMDNRSSILFLKDQDGWGNYLKEQGVVLTLRKGNIRISFHFYNTKEELDQVLKIIKSRKI